MVPTQTTDALGAAEADKPIALEMVLGTAGEGDPDLLGVSPGDRAAALYRARGRAGDPVPRSRAARTFSAPTTGTASTRMLARTQAFDAHRQRVDGDFERLLVDPDSGDFSPLTLQPGQTGTIDVTFTPRGGRGDVVRGADLPRRQPHPRTAPPWGRTERHRRRVALRPPARPGLRRR